MNLLDDPRYEGFVERYGCDPLAFAIEVTGLTPSVDQVELFDEMAADTARVSVVSGTSTGKTVAFGRLALWHLLLFPYAIVDGTLEIGSNTYVGAPVVQQVADGVWKGINDAVVSMKSSPHAWVAEYFTVTKTRVYVNGYSEQWFIAQMAMVDGNAISIAGKHRYWQLIIVDEASGVSEDHFNVINGTQTQGGNRTLLASQGARNAGFFYDTHHKLARAAGGAWSSLRFSSEDSPFVTAQWLFAREMECGGRHTVEYQIRVLGLFAEDTSNVLLSRAEVERAFSVGPVIGSDEQFGWLHLADVAMGEYRDDSVHVFARVIGYADFGADARRVEFETVAYCGNDKNPIDFAGDLADAYHQGDNATLLVDNGGSGATVVRLIERSDVPVVRVDWGKPCFRTEHKARFVNQRAAANVLFRDAIRAGRVRLPQGLDKRLRSKIVDQGSRLPYEFRETGGLKYLMKSKDAMRADGIDSPDVWDCFAFAFLPGADYIVAAGAGAKSAERGSVDRAMERMKAEREARRAALEDAEADEDAEAT